jgi:maltodextrin utilization protein YvdJ
MNYLIINEQGWRLDFIEESFSNQTPNWILPEECAISSNELLCMSTEEYTFSHQGIQYIFNYQGTNYDRSLKQVIFTKTNIIYTNGEDAQMIGYDYKGFTEDVNFRSINLMEGTERTNAYIKLGTQIEQTFGPYIIFYTVLVNTLISIGLNILFILLLSLVLQLFRFGYSTFFKYTESLKFLVLMMGLPALLSFLVGLIEPAFSPVFFQFGMGLATMLTMLIYGKKVFI